ncbi:hypothetical protein PMAYCL1PPCAC_24352, partial [Pristionchus mayeri]
GSLDASDSLNWKITPLLLAVCAFIIGGSQAFGEPISCFHPREIKVWYQYVSGYCFLEGSYKIPQNMTLHDVAKMTRTARADIREANPVETYQWVPFLLSFQLIMFVSPGLIWKWARKRQSLDLDTILEHTQGIRDSMGNSEEREEKMHDLVGYLFETLRDQTNRENHSLTLLFLFTKLMTLLNVIYQFICLMYFIRSDSVFFGYEILSSFASGSPTSRFFPLEVLCDLSFGHDVHGRQWYTMQCYLSLNYFHDKMFALLWVWYLFIIGYSMVSFLLFSFSLIPLDRSIRSHFSPELYETNKRLIRTFYNRV